MRKLSAFTLAFLAVCLLVGSLALAQGQEGRRGRGGFGGGFGQMGTAQLLGNEQVQKELQLTDDQTAKIKEITAALRPQRGAGGGANFREMTDEQRQAFRAEIRKKSEEAGQKATALLTADQNTRLKQIELWVQGAGGLTENADVAKQLGLTDDQKGALKTILEESRKKSQELRAGMRNADQDERTRIQGQLAELRTNTDTECLAVLTDDQKSQFAKLKGPKFELDRSALGGGRGGRGRRGGNNN